MRRIGLLCLLLISASLGVVATRRTLTRESSGLLPLTLTLRPQEFRHLIAANGELQSEESVAVAVPNVPVQRLRVAAVVPDGRPVVKGDVIVEFDPAEIVLQAQEHKSSLEMANQKISRGQLAIGAEKADILKDRKLAELELEKITEFLPKDEQIYSRREIIEAQLNKDYVEKKIVFADARFELKGKVYSLDEAILALERQQAGNKVGQAEKALASLKLTAPASGIVVYNDPGYFFGGYTLQPGRVVWIGMNLFSLVNPDRMEAKCYVLEREAGDLAVGQSVTVTLDPFPGTTFTGKLKSVDKLARPIDRDSPVKYFQVLVALDRTDPLLMKPGVKVKARILAGDVKSAIVVPRSALVKKDNRYFAYVQRSANRFEPVPVTLGRGDLIQVIVQDGLEPGHVLALNPPDVKSEFSPDGKKSPRSSQPAATS
jgi:multidrug efflux pump subunit AcrA (membrane-fusion protein)